MNSKIVLILILTFSPISVAIAIDENILNVPSEDSLYKYYLGIAEDYTSLQQAINVAAEQASEDAIKENFGFYTQINKNTFSDTKNIDYKYLNQFSTKQIHLTGFEKIKNIISQNEDTKKYSVKSLFRYVKKNIAEELTRLKNSSSNIIEASQVGSSESQMMASLEIATIPVNTNIMIDDMIYPKTPLKIIGQIDPGKHKIYIDHPYFDSITKEIEFNEHEFIKLEYILTPAKSLVSFDTNVDRTSAFVNGQFIGETPIHDYQVESGKGFDLELRNSKVISQQLKGIMLNKGPQDLGKINLRLLNGKLKISTTESNIEIKIDENTNPTINNLIELYPGDHEVHAHKHGFEDQTIKVHIEPNETTNINVKMKPIEINPDILKPAPNVKNDYYLQALFGLDSASTPINNFSGNLTSLFAELHFGVRKIVGISLGAKSGTAPNQSQPNADAKYSSEYSSAKFGFWFKTFAKESERFAIGYEYERGLLQVASLNNMKYPEPLVKTPVNIQGSGPAVLFHLLSSNQYLCTLQFGYKNFSSDRTIYSGKSQTYINIAFGYDFLGK